VLLATILFGALGLGILIFVHECGHFLAAKANGVTVEVFSLGWGRRLVGFDYRGTSYQISWFPLGGYCRMKGENDATLRSEWRLGDSEHRPEQGSFFAAAAWQRILIIAAGPLANLLFALLVLTVIWWAGFRIDSPGTRIVSAADHTLDAVPAQTPAIAAGLRSGDRIVSIDGHEVVTFRELRRRVAAAPGRLLKLMVERDGTLLATDVTPELDARTGAGRIWVYPWIDPVVEVRLGGAAAADGLRTGDRIVAVNGSPVRHSIDVLEHFRPSAEGLSLAVAVERDGARQVVTLEPAQAGGDPGFGFVVPRLRTPRLSPAAALARAGQDTGRLIGATVNALARLFGGGDAPTVAGPLRITYDVGRAASDGFARGVGTGLVQFFRLLCAISIVLCVMNLLPLPALDGGHIVLYLIELIRGRQLPPALLYRIQVLGFSLLLTLALVVTFGDILFFVGR
jgi:regulator of sigma E protease